MENICAVFYESDFTYAESCSESWTVSTLKENTLKFLKAGEILGKNCTSMHEKVYRALKKSQSLIKGNVEGEFFSLRSMNSACFFSI